MQTIIARNVNDAWDQAKLLINTTHVVRPSRVGEVWEYPEPVTTVYMNPCERVLFDPVRNCNPFFHIMEALWMISGRNDVEWIARFNERMRQYSDDGKIFHGAYGHRWRRRFIVANNCGDPVAPFWDGYDQLQVIARMLKANPDERRA